MSTWLEQFAAQLGDIEKSRGAVTRGDSPRDAALRLLAMKGNTPDVNQKLASTPGGHKAFTAGNVKDEFLDGGGRILDLLSRGMYGSAGAIGSLAADERKAREQGNTVLPFGVGVDYNWTEAAKHLGSGWAGREKNTFSDVLHDNGVTGKKAGIAGFALDVALDPTTYIGAGAIKAGLKAGSKGVQAATKAAGHEVDLTKLGRAKNTLSTEDVLSPAEKAKADLAAKGTANASDSVVKRILAENAKKSHPAEDQLPFIVEKGGIANDRKTVADIIDEPRPVGEGTANVPGQTAMDFMASAAHDSAQKELNTVLSDVPNVRRYPKKLNVTAPFKEVEETTQSPFVVNKTREIPNPDFIEPKEVLKAGINRLVKENFDRSSRGFKVWGTLSNKPADKVFIKGDHLTGGESVSRISPKTLAEWVKEGRVPTGVEPYHFIVDGKKVKIADYVRKLHSEYDDAGSVFNENMVVQHYKDVEMRSVTTKKMKAMPPVERMAWAKQYEDILDPADLQHLYRTANLGPRAFSTAWNKIKDKEALRSFGSAQELREARQAGLIGDTAMQVLKGRLSDVGASNVFNLEKKVTRLKKALDDAALKPSKANKAEVKKASAAVEKAVDKADLRVDAQDIMQNPAVKENVAARTAHAFDSGDVSDWVRPQQVLNEKQAAAVQSILKDVNLSEFVNPRNQPWRTNRDVMRDSATPGVGHGWAKGFNKYSQMTLGKRVISAASKMVRGTPKNLRPAAMYDATMPMLHASEQVLRQNGIPLILGKNATGLPLSMHDVLSALPRPFVEKYYFSPDRAMDITQLSDIVEQHLLLGLGQRDAATVNHAVGKLVKNYARPKNSGTSAFTASLNGNADSVVKEIETAFATAGPKIMEALSKNSAEAAIKFGDETRALTDEGMKAFNAVVTNPNSTASEVIKAALESYNPVRTAARTRDIPVSGPALVQAEQATAAHVAETLPMPVVATYARAAQTFKKAGSVNDFAKIQVKLADSADVEARSILEILQGIDSASYQVMDLGMRAEFANGVRLFRAFAPHLGNENLRPILTERLSVAQSLAKRFTQQLGRINAQFPKADAAEAFRRLQAGEEPSTPAMEAMQSVLKEIFDKNPEYGLLMRNGIRSEALAEKFKKFGIGDHFALDKTNPDLSWQKWSNVEDPLDLLSKYHAAVNSVVAENQLGANISSMFGRRSPGAEGNWVKIKDPHGKSKLATLINKDLYYPEDIARQMHMIDITLEELAKPNSSNSFLRTLDSALHSYKAGVTIYRPGHHVRNMVGDIWLSSMDGVTPIAYKKATAVMATRQSQYADFDAQRALQAAYRAEGTSPKTILTLTIDGKKTPLTADQVYRMAFDSGVLPDYSVLEDVSFGATQQADRVADTLKKFSPAKGKIHKVATGVSEYRDHYVRIAHFIHALEQSGGIKTGLKNASDVDRAAHGLKQASFIAGSRVRKWHPDGSDLSDFEKRYARRAILFYSWVRKAIPLVVESTVVKPGRVMVYPKAMQNVAAANGIDLDGMGDPFPVDQLFPSYIADSTQGPQWGSAGSYMGIKPGIPNMDVMDDYAASPGDTAKAVFGSVNPLFKVPFEVASGTQVRTGTPIMDSSDYVDSQIPGANYVAKLLGGKSPSSVLVPGDGQLIQDTRVSPSNAGYQGNPNSPGKGGTDFINWLLGLSMTDYSRPSSIVSARRERGGH